MEVFDFDDYKAFLEHRIAFATRRRGYRTVLAGAAGCQPAYLSQVLRGNAQLVPDQAARLCGFWGMEGAEAEYFMNLVHRERAGSADLRKICQKTLDRIRAEQGELSRRLRVPERLETKHQSLYYSQWYWAAIHVAVSLPGLGRPEAIAQKLVLPVDLVRDVLDSLLEMGLVSHSKAGFRIAKAAIHIGKDSPFVRLNHFNWQQRALRDFQSPRESAIHFSGVFAMSARDVAKVRELMFDALKRTRELAAPSPEEELLCVVLDCFQP